MSGLQQMLWLIVYPLLALMALGILLLALGYGRIAPMVTLLGTVLVVTAVLFWIVLFDSKRRWPGTPLGIRLYRVMAMQRG